MQSIGAGIKYYPFSDDFSFDFGGEVFNARVDVTGRFIFLRESFEDSIFGWGANAGISYEKEIAKVFSFFASGGYFFSDNESRHINFDFNSYYAFIGLKFNLTGRQQ